IEYVGRIKSALFGGEGLFFATLRGPGRIWLQSLPLSRMARRIVAAAPQTGRGGREEGSVLGTIGDILSGDRQVEILKLEMQDSSNFKISRYRLPAGARRNQHVAGDSFRDEPVGVSLKQEACCDRFGRCRAHCGYIAVVILIPLLPR